jgi:hypothetical protein
MPAEIDSEFIYYEQASGELYWVHEGGDGELLAILDNKAPIIQDDLVFA